VHQFFLVAPLMAVVARMLPCREVAPEQLLHRLDTYHKDVIDSDGLRLPDFIGTGPPRTGTTWLDESLRRVTVLPEGIKETRFFLNHYRKGIQWYADHFRDGGEDMPVGEFDPNLFFVTDPQRVLSHLPECRLICTMRDPVDRAYSLYKHMRRRGRTSADVEGWILRMKDGNRYASALRKWQTTFGPARLMITRFDNLRSDPQTYIDSICDFVGAPRVMLTPWMLDKAKRNTVERAPRSIILAWSAAYVRKALRYGGADAIDRRLAHAGLWEFCAESGESYPPLDPKLDARLREHFRPEVEALEDLLGWDLSAWKLARDSHA